MALLSSIAQKTVDISTDLVDDLTNGILQPSTDKSPPKKVERKSRPLPLPSTVALKLDAARKFLGFIDEGFLQYSIAEAANPYAKFALENAGDGLVHIRCARNNKYWARKSENESWIAATEKEHVEDESAWNCTLFRPDVSDDGNNVSFYHVQSQKNVGYKPKDDQAHKMCLCLEPLATTLAVSKVIDYDSLVILPKLVAFRGDNDSYLSLTQKNGFTYLQFKADDVGDSQVRFHMFTTPEGYVRIRSEHSGKFWRHDPNWIKCDSTDKTDNNRHTLFEVIKVEDDVIALRSLGNNNFIKRLTYDDKTNCLNAAVSSITKEARFKVEEPVIRRKVTVIDFRLNDARIYDKSVLLMTSGVATNTTDTKQEVQLQLSFDEKSSSTWTNSLSIKVGFEYTFSSGVPAMAGSKFTISAEFTSQYQWGETKEFSQEVKTVYTVTVPPHSKSTVRLLATKAQCDIPFNYLQVDQLTTGERKTAIMDDGVYKGVNTYDFEYETTHKKLP